MEKLPSTEPRTVGYFTIMIDPPNVTDPFYERTTLGIVSEMNKGDRALLLRCEQGLCQEDQSCVKPFFDESLGGILLLSPNLDDSKICFLKKLKIPLVLIYGQPKDADFAFIDMDNKKGARQVMEHLLSLGHKRIAFIGGDVALNVDARDRFLGYQEEMRKAGLAEDPQLVHHKSFWANHGYDSMKRMMLLPAGQRPTAVFGANDVIALGAKQAAEESGLEIPSDLSIVGFDDIKDAQESVPPLTTVRQPFYEIGQRAVGLLMKLIKDPMDPDRHVSVEPSLITRASTAVPKN
jgi:DNA-binding LacI/PurR family transcriptional regulator